MGLEYFLHKYQTALFGAALDFGKCVVSSFPEWCLYIVRITEEFYKHPVSNALSTIRYFSLVRVVT